MPLAVSRVLAVTRGQGVRPAPGLVAGWLVEPVAEAERQVWVWGAGHVGRALVSVLAPLPGIAVTWVDVSAERFPDLVPEGVTVVPASDPAVVADHAPLGAEHLVMTFSHPLDLELCHRLLVRGFRSCGLIGSATKWGRFRSRLKALGHEAAEIGRIRCPIGDPSLGKHPQAIAVGVVAELLRAPMTAVGEKRA
jgi:xanthine dehydrogenase accessory factor